MATRTQAKAAIDAVSTDAKTFIDYIPVGANIVDGQINFAPNQWTVRILVLDTNEMTSVENSITAGLTADARVFTISRQRRRTEGRRGVTITVGLNSFLISL
jgi:hypothetical protein